MSLPNNQTPASGSDSGIISSITKGIKNIFLDSTSPSPAHPNTPPNRNLNESENATSISSTSDPELDDDELDHSWTIISNEDTNHLTTPWTLEADRALCTLHFFTTYSLSTIASLLNYSLSSPMPIRIRPHDAKDRFLLLAKQEGYTRAFVYYEIKRLGESNGADWTSAVLASNAGFARAWKEMARDVEAQRFLGEERKFRIGREGVNQTGYDQLSDENYILCLGSPRKWPVEERKRLQKFVWMGLGSGVVRLDPGGMESQMSVEVQGVRIKQVEDRKKGWFW